MKIRIENAENIENGVWIASASRDELNFLPGPKLKRTGASVLYCRNISVDAKSGSISLPLMETEVLVLGASSTVLILEDDKPIISTSISDPTGSGELPSDVVNFLNECKKYLSDDLLEPTVSLFRRLRENLEFSMHEGKARKWTAHPNYLAVTIQSRNRVLLVSVHGHFENLNKRYKSIKAVRGRGDGYSEFKFWSKDQLDDVFDIIMESSKA